MTEIEEQIHRTWVQLLVDYNYKELAAVALDCVVSVIYSNYAADGLSIDIPPSSFGLINQNDKYKETLTQSLKTVSKGYIYDQNRGIINDLDVFFRIKLIKVEPNWQNKVQELILNCTKANQGLISKFSFAITGLGVSWKLLIILTDSKKTLRNTYGLKKSGILCIQHFTAEKCYNSPGIVVNKFIDVLSKHKR